MQSHRIIEGIYAVNLRARERGPITLTFVVQKSNPVRGKGSGEWAVIGHGLSAVRASKREALQVLARLEKSIRHGAVATTEEA